MIDKLNSRALYRVECDMKANTVSGSRSRPVFGRAVSFHRSSSSS